MEKIPYSQIPPGSRKFRILNLHSSTTFSAPITCTLIDASLDFHPPYEALSYVWGSLEKTQSITLNDKTALVTQNLFTALQHLRQQDQPRNLWVDALCINQHNVSERSDQVLHMAEIYQHCSTDLLWLGPGRSIIARGAAVMDAIGTITDLEEKVRLKCFYRDWHKGDRWRRYRGEHNDDDRLSRLPEDWTDVLRDLFRAPVVWQRVWIMQEVSFAPRVVLVAGSGATMEWERVDAFLDVEKYLELHGFPDAFHGPFSHGWTLKDELTYCLAHVQILGHQRRIAASILAARQQQDENEKIAVAPTSSLLDVLARFRHTRATDPRDMVFALLGLTSNRLSVTPTYTDSVCAVNTFTAAAIINACRNLDLLCQSPWAIVDNRGRDAASYSLPSWVPDFANPGYGRILFAQRGIYSACGDRQLETPCTVTEDGALVLDGWDAGELRVVRNDVRGYPASWSQRAMQFMPDDVLRAGIRAGNESLRRFLKNEDEAADGDGGDSRSGAAMGGSRFEEYWRTLMVDCRRYPVARLKEEDLRAWRPKWEAWMKMTWVVKTYNYDGGHSHTSPEQEGDSRLKNDVERVTIGLWPWVFAVLEDGSYAMVQKEMEVGDRVVVLKGSKAPVVLRRAVTRDGEGQGAWILMGACYVHGLMDGEMTRKNECKRKFAIM